MRKNIFWSLIGTFGIFLLATACDKEDENGATTKNSLVATWIWTDMTISGCDDGDNNAAISGTCTNENCTKVRLTSDGKVVNFGVDDGEEWSEGGGTFEATEGNKVRICEDGDCETMTYQISGNTLTFTGTDEDSGCNISMKYTKD